MKILSINVLAHEGHAVVAKATVDASEATPDEIQATCDKVIDYLNREWVIENTDPDSPVRAEFLVFLFGPKDEIISIIE